MRKILIDDSFEVTNSAKKIKEIATRLISWAPHNSSYFNIFSEVIVTTLNNCFEVKKSTSEQIDFMWRKYHSIRASLTFQQAWIQLLTHALDKSSAKSSFYQHTTELIFSTLISLHYKKDLNTATRPSYHKLTNIEENIIRYIAGYVCHKMQSKLECNRNLDLLLIIAEMSGCELDESLSSEYWTNILDRGGLFHINDNTYLLFCALEKELQQYLKVDRAIMGQNDTNEIVDTLISNNDVQFLWNSITGVHPHINITSSNQLLRDMVQLFVTIRGFAFAKSLLEAYKQVSSKSLQKSKGLRKALNGRDVTK